MSYLAYKVLHIVGILAVFLALGGLAARSLDGSTDMGSRAAKLAGMTHGLALILVLVSGFGLIAKLGTGFALWVWLKLAVWLVLGAMIALVRRMPQFASLLWFTIPLLGALAAYLALYKPGA